MAKKKAPLVLIEWEDSAQPVSRWQHLSGLPASRAIRCASVGWLVEDGPHVKALAPNFGALDDTDNLQISGLIKIPARCIFRTVRLKEPHLKKRP